MTRKTPLQSALYRESLLIKEVGVLQAKIAQAVTALDAIKGDNSLLIQVNYIKIGLVEVKP